jgi:hypothetical protein
MALDQLKQIVHGRWWRLAGILLDGDDGGVADLDDCLAAQSQIGLRDRQAVVPRAEGRPALLGSRELVATRTLLG